MFFIKMLCEKSSQKLEQDNVGNLTIIEFFKIYKIFPCIFHVQQYSRAGFVTHFIDE